MKKRKVSLELIIISISYLLLMSCKQNRAQIGMLIASPVFKPELAYFSDLLSKSGVSVNAADANYDDKLQISQARTLINQGVKVLVIIPVNTNTAAAIVRLAIEKNVKTIAYERIISNCKLDYFVSFDNVRIGELLAREAIRLKPNGSYFVMSGDKSDRNAVWVHEGFYKAMEPSLKSGLINIVYDTYIEDWSSGNALCAVERYLRLSGKVPDVILSAYNGMNADLFDYFDKENITPVPLVAGQDMDTKETRKSTNARQRISLYKSSKIEAEIAADMALKLLNKQDISVDQKVNNGMVDVNTIVIKEMKVESY
jgi:D-xylose transport system substrate-binding protein